MNVSKNPIKIERWRLAQLLGISERTLRRMFNELYFDELKKIGYTKGTLYIFQQYLDYVFPNGIDFEYTNK